MLRIRTSFTVPSGSSLATGNWKSNEHVIDINWQEENKNSQLDAYITPPSDLNETDFLAIKTPQLAQGGMSSSNEL